MPFNGLLLTSLTHKTHCEDKNRVSVEPKKDLKSGEKVLFFELDKDLNPKAKFRKILKEVYNSNDSKVCDCLIFFKSPRSNTICLAELKGSDIDKAVKQLTETGKKLKNLLEKLLVKQYGLNSEFHKINWKALIAIHGSGPKNLKKHEGNLSDVFDDFKLTRNPKVASFLRK